MTTLSLIASALGLATAYFTYRAKAVKTPQEKIREQIESERLNDQKIANDWLNKP